MKIRLLALCTALMAGCGGSSNTPSNPAPIVSQSPGGIWVVEGTPEPVATMFVAESGEINTIESLWFGAGAVIVTNGNEVSGSYERHLSMGVTTDPRTFQQDCEITGTVNERVSLSMTINCVDGTGAREQHSYELTYDSDYEGGSSLSTIAGNYAVPANVITNMLSINSDGTIFGTFQPGSTSCTVNGLAELIDPEFTIYRIETTLSSCIGPAAEFFEDARMRGLAIAEPSVAETATFRLLISAAFDGGNLVVYVQSYSRV